MRLYGVLTAASFRVHLVQPELASETIRVIADPVQVNRKDICERKRSAQAAEAEDVQLNSEGPRQHFQIAGLVSTTISTRV